MVGCQPYARAAFTSRKYSWYSFPLETELTPGPYCDRKDFMSMKNPLTTTRIEPATFRFVAQHKDKQYSCVFVKQISLFLTTQATCFGWNGIVRLLRKNIKRWTSAIIRPPFSWAVVKYHTLHCLTTAKENAACGENVEFANVTRGASYTNHWTLKG